MTDDPHWKTRSSPLRSEHPQFDPPSPEEAKRAVDRTLERFPAGVQETLKRPLSEQQFRQEVLGEWSEQEESILRFEWELRHQAFDIPRALFERILLTHPGLHHERVEADVVRVYLPAGGMDPPPWLSSES